MLREQMDTLDAAVIEVAEKNEKAKLLMTQLGVGPITSLAFVLTMRDVNRFPRGKQVASYLGLIPREFSAGGKPATGIDQQAGEPVYAHAAGGSGADSGAQRSRDAE
jgi:transposase